MQKKFIISLLNEIFKGLQFKKQGNNWYLDNEVIIKKVNLQKSNFSNLYYINFGYILKDIELGRLNMHVYNRLSSKDIQEKNRIKELLDFDNSINDDVRKNELTYLINKLIVEKFQQINNEDDLLAELRSRENLNDIPTAIKKYFNLKVD